jgi:dynamin 1-like protein
VQLVYEELRRIISDLEISEFKKFGNLRQKIVEVMYNLLSKSLQPTIKMIKDLIIIEDSYINTYHPDFMGGAAAVLNIFDVNAY